MKLLARLPFCAPSFYLKSESSLLSLCQKRQIIADSPLRPPPPSLLEKVQNKTTLCSVTCGGNFREKLFGLPKAQDMDFFPTMISEYGVTS